jgi:hypothetical protein
MPVTDRYQDGLMPVTDRHQSAATSTTTTTTTTLTGTEDSITDFTATVFAALREVLPDWTALERDQETATQLAAEGYTAEQVVDKIRACAGRAQFQEKRGQGTIRGLAYFARAIRGDLLPACPAVPVVTGGADHAPPVADSTACSEDITPEQAIWQAALDQICQQVSPADFDDWVRDTTVVYRVDGRWVIGAPQADTREWLEHRLKKLVRKTLAGLVGAAVVVEFVDVSAAGPLPPAPVGGAGT